MPTPDSAEVLSAPLALWRQWRLNGDETPLLTQVPTLVEQLHSGSNHLIYKLVADQQYFVLRINQPHRRALAMSLTQEVTLQRIASEQALAPDIVFHQGDWTVSRFIDAHAWPAKLDQRIEALAHQLRKLHQLKVPDTGFDLIAHSRTYFDKLPQPNTPQTALHQKLLVFTEQTLQRFPARCLCHNDLIPGNILLAPLPQLIDWEYAGSNHPAFDLTSLLEWGQLNPAQQQRLLNAYQADEPTVATNPECLQAFRLIVRYVEWLWLLQITEQGEREIKEQSKEAQTCQHRLEQALASSQFTNPI